MIGVGELLSGRYRIDGVQGAGGMGVVLAAHDVQLDRAVCLKIPKLADESAARARLVREARFASRLRGEHACRIFDVIELPDNAACIVMERIDGRDLHAEVATRGPLPVDEAIDTVRQACRALAEAHALGIVHRDIKPQNLLLSRRLDGTPLVKVVDFGFARAIDDVHSTSGGGSPAFVAPEQLRRGSTTDPSADVYALGAVLFFVLCGRPPFVAPDAVAVMLMALSSAPPSPSRYRPDIPPALAHVIAKCIDPRPTRRYRDASELDAALATLERAPAPHGARRARRSVAAFEIALLVVVAVVVARPAMHAGTGAAMGAGTIMSVRPAVEPRRTVGVSTPAVSMPAARGPTPPVERVEPAPLLAQLAAPGPAVSAPVPHRAPRARVRAKTSVRPAATGKAAVSANSRVQVPAESAPCWTDDFLCQFGSRGGP